MTSRRTVSHPSGAPQQGIGTYRSTMGSSTGEDVSGVAANAGTARATTITRANHHRKDTFRHCSFLLNWRAITLPSRQSEAIVSRSEHTTIGGHRYRLGYMYILPDYQAKVNDNL